MKILKILFCVSFLALLLACTSKEDDAKKLGFKSVEEMETIQAKGFKTRNDFDTEVERKKSQDEKLLKEKKRNEILQYEGKQITSQELWGGYNCKQDSNYMCIDLEKFVEFCNLVDGMSNETLKRLGKFPYAYPTKDIEYLLENGGLNGYKVNLLKDSNQKPVCQITISVVGFYKGSQVNKVLQGFVTSFIVSNGELLTYEAREGSPF